MIQFDLHPDRRSSTVSLENILKNYTTDNDCSVSSGGRLVQEKSATAAALSLDFTAWLQTSLEQFGVDAALYVRCVCSILRQPPDSNTHEDDFDDLVEDYEFIGGATVFVSDGNVGVSGQVSAGVKKSSIMRDDRRTALVECLKSIDDSPAVVLSFADEILLRYKIAAIGNNFEQGSCTKKFLNESNDSGVCASPVDALAVNYEEEFPPLCDSFEEIKLISAAEPNPSCVSTVQSAVSGAEDGRRPLLRSSYPTFHAPATNRPKFGSFSAFAYVSSSPPQFVLPKCERVGSGPSKLAAKFDVPLWQCTCAEWFCPIHKSVELSALASKVYKSAPAADEPTSGRSLDELFDAPKFILGIICEDDDGSIQDDFSVDQVRFVQPMVAPPAPRCAIDQSSNNDQFSSLTKVNSHQQHQQLIPVTPQTHFVPIRSESMEDCFQSKPFGLDEELAVAAGGNMSMTEATVDEARFVYRTETDGGCFPLTFKALNPSIASQTEPERSYGWSMEENFGWPADETQFALELAENEDDGGNLMIIECLQRQDDQDDDRLLQYVSNISLISPLNT